MAVNFDPSLSYAWVIADAASAITTFDASAFQLSLSGFQNGYIGVWGVVLGGSPGVGGDSS